MSVCADANITGTVLHFWTHKVHYKLQQSTLQNVDDGGLLSGWSFVRWSYVRWSFVRTPRALASSQPHRRYAATASMDLVVQL